MLEKYTKEPQTFWEERANWKLIDNSDDSSNQLLRNYSEKNRIVGINRSNCVLRPKIEEYFIEWLYETYVY